MKGALIYLGLALVISALVGSVWVFIGAIGLLIVVLILGLLGILTIPGESSKVKSKKSGKCEPPDYVMFDDLDDI